MSDIEEERLYVRNFKYYPGHPETGGSVAIGICPHCGKWIQQRDYNEETCDYCDGLIKWNRF